MWLEIWNQARVELAGRVPYLVAAVAVALVGWALALILAAAVRGALRRTHLDNLLARWIVGEERASSIDVAGTVGRGTFYLLMLVVAVAFLQVLGLTIVTEPINRLLTQIFAFLPQVLGALLLLLVAWAVASVTRLLAVRLFGAWGLDRKLRSGADLKEDSPLGPSKTLGDVIYYIILVLFLPAILGALSLGGLLRPVESMAERLLAFLPNIFGAAVILLAGWLAARMIRFILVKGLLAAGADRLGQKIGMRSVLGEQGIPGLVGTVAYTLILIPVLIAALNALNLEAITNPASNMLNTIWGILPGLFAAVLVVFLSYVVGKLLGRLVANLLAEFGFDNLLVRLRLAKASREEGWRPSAFAGTLTMVAVVLLAGIEALRLLRFDAVADLAVQLTTFGGHVLLGLIVFGLGLALALFVFSTISARGGVQARVLAVAAQVAILILSSAVALRQMGLAPGIINLAFGILLGAGAVAFAIAFGLGGRSFAEQQITKWRTSVQIQRPGSSDRTDS